jgi:hypothetical protein
MGERHSASCACSQHFNETQPGAEFSLYRFIDTTKIWAQGKNPAAAKQIFKSHAERHDVNKFFDSHDGDARLLINVPFTGTIKLKSLCFIGGEHGAWPGHVKLFTNRDDLEFDLAARLKPVQEFDVPPGGGGAAEPLEFPVIGAKFSNVHLLSLYFTATGPGAVPPPGAAAAPGSPPLPAAGSLRLYYVGLKGEFAPAAKHPTNITYELRPQAADHKAHDEAKGRMGL